jgi:predicted Zn-dependent protease
VSEAGSDTGYLCAELERVARIRLQRWRVIEGPLVVHVPRPAFENGIDPVALQRAAMLGVRAWNNQPFAILVDTRGDRNPHFALSWTGTLSGTQIGVARTQWSPQTGLDVLSIELAMRNPYDPSRMNDPMQVRLTAAHEMGHALGLLHSDSERDVMYPTNTATSLSARDYRTMESLYGLPDGTEIVR